MTPLFRKFLGINWVIVANIVILITFGIYAIYNAADGRPGLMGKWNQQVMWSGIGGVVFFVTALLDYRWLRWGAWPLYLMSLAGIILVKVIGKDHGVGAKSWIDVGPISVQPSQFAIVAGIIVLAIVFGDLQRVAPIFRYPFLRLALGGILAAVPMILILKEPDLGSAAVWGPMFVCMILVGSIPYRYLIVLALLAMTFLPIAYFFGLKPYQKQRIDTFISMLTNQKVNVREDAWVPYHLQLAVGSAGFEGKGPLSHKVPDQHSIHRTFFRDLRGVRLPRHAAARIRAQPADFSVHFCRVLCPRSDGEADRGRCGGHHHDLYFHEHRHEHPTCAHHRPAPAFHQLWRHLHGGAAVHVRPGAERLGASQHFTREETRRARRSSLIATP